MPLERKAQDANNNGYPAQVYGVLGQYEKSAQGTMVAGATEKNTYEIEYTFDFADLPSSFTSTDLSVLTTIPSNAYIESCDVKVLSTISGGTNYDIGLSQPDGTVIDANGLVAAATGTTGHFRGAGAVIGTATTTNAQVTVGGTRTAGVIQVTVKYSQ